jgi:hypothetical protein
MPPDARGPSSGINLIGFQFQVEAGALRKWGGVDFPAHARLILNDTEQFMADDILDELTQARTNLEAVRQALKPLIEAGIAEDSELAPLVTRMQRLEGVVARLEDLVLQGLHFPQFYACKVLAAVTRQSCLM